MAGPRNKNLDPDASQQKKDENINYAVKRYSRNIRLSLNRTAFFKKGVCQKPLFFSIFTSSIFCAIFQNTAPYENTSIFIIHPPYCSIMQHTQKYLLTLTELPNFHHIKHLDLLYIPRICLMILL